MSRRDFLNTTLQSAGALLCLPGKLHLSVFAAAANPREKALQEGSEEGPSYLRLHKSGTLADRVRELLEIYKNCSLCPRDCRVDRTKGQKGKCQATSRVRISSGFAHFGEEAPLVGQNGSGTIFFSHCGLRCIYCQNYTISHEGEGVDVPDERLAQSMMKLQELGCHNINLVTPTHYLPNIINALDKAVPMGLRIPLVYNTSGYEKAEILRLLEGVVDIYLPDCKYMDPEMSAKYSSEAYNYPYYVRPALLEMFRQVGDLAVSGRGVARRGLLIRHLVLPNRIAGTKEFLKFVAESLPRTTYINLMRQYRPEYKAFDIPELSRRTNPGEYNEALSWARSLGLNRLDR